MRPNFNRTAPETATKPQIRVHRFASDRVAKMISHYRSNGIGLETGPNPLDPNLYEGASVRADVNLLEHSRVEGFRSVLADPGVHFLRDQGYRVYSMEVDSRVRGCDVYLVRAKDHPKAIEERAERDGLTDGEEQLAGRFE